MGLIRLLIILAIAWLVWQVVRRYLLAPRAKLGKSEPPRGGTMVRCAHCGLHVPQQEAFRDGDRFYCSPQHLELDRERTR